MPSAGDQLLLFASLLPFSIATGRLGCWLSGCCLGLEWDGPLALAGVDGVPRVPAPLIELGFHLLAGIGLVRLWRKRRLAGRLFAVCLVTCGRFRFASEFWRVTPEAFAGFSAYRWFALAMVLAGAVALYLRRDRASPAHQDTVLDWHPKEST